MKIQYKFLLTLFFLFSTSCEGKRDVRVSGPDFFNQLLGVYEGVHNNRGFEVRIDELERDSATGERLLSLFVFEKRNLSSIQAFLTKYQDVQAYSKAICKYVEDNPDKFSNYNLQTAPTMFHDISADEVWSWGKKPLGSLGHFVFRETPVSSFDIKPMHYIDLYKDDEYGVIKLYVHSSGEAVKIQFFETGFIKKPWNYIISGPSLNISKVSSKTEGLYAQYYSIVNETVALFEKAGRENRSYCSAN